MAPKAAHRVPPAEDIGNKDARAVQVAIGGGQSATGEQAAFARCDHMVACSPHGCDIYGPGDCGNDGAGERRENHVVSTQPSLATRRLRDQRVGHGVLGTPSHTRQPRLRRYRGRSRLKVIIGLSEQR